MNPDDCIEHFGIKGQKWGMRRYQYKDGSLTPAGKKRYAKLREELDRLGVKEKKESGSKNAPSKNKPATALGKVRTMSDSELNKAINRMNSEQRYLDLQKSLSKYDQKTITKGQKVMKHINQNILLPVLDDAGKALLRQSFSKLLKVNLQTQQNKKKK